MSGHDVDKVGIGDEDGGHVDHAGDVRRTATQRVHNDQPQYSQHE